MSREGSSIGENIRRVRKAAGMTQEELAAKAGMYKGSIAQYERGLRSPKNEYIKKIASALDVSYSELDPDVLGNDADLVNQAFTRGYQTGYETAKKEVLERMKTWLGGKEDDPDGKDKDHEKTPG